MLYLELNIVFLFILVVVSITYAVMNHGEEGGYLAFNCGAMKETVTILSLFILVKPLADLSGFSIQGGAVPIEILWVVTAVLLGGRLGAYFRSQRIPVLSLRSIRSDVFALACLKLMLL